MSRRKSLIIAKEEDTGEVIDSFQMNAADDDWIRARRLSIAAEAGDKEAAEELNEMYDTPMVYEKE